MTPASFEGEMEGGARNGGMVDSGQPLRDSIEPLLDHRVS
jgi:hypothetical protein